MKEDCEHLLNNKFSTFNDILSKTNDTAIHVKIFKH